jgi:signal transduction histidine kinase
VVRSSLDNLRAATLPDEARVYMERAQQGLTRLTHILTRMTEATRLEQSLGEAQRERFDLAKIVAGCVDGYRAAYPQRQLDLMLPPGSFPVDGAPELIAQLLDKLVANAVEFGAPGTPIAIVLERVEDGVSLQVENEGAPLPAGMQERLFDSMVSIRTVQKGDEPHLGLGLYIVRLIAAFHRGRVRAVDRDDGRGVAVSVTMPLAA